LSLLSDGAQLSPYCISCLFAASKIILIGAQLFTTASAAPSWSNARGNQFLNAPALWGENKKLPWSVSQFHCARGMQAARAAAAQVVTAWSDLIVVHRDYLKYRHSAWRY
jgi:hypothetical protein